MKKKLFFAVAFLSFIPQLLLWGMDATIVPPTDKKKDETIFPSTGKQYGTDGWQKPVLVTKGSQSWYEPPLIKDDKQDGFDQTLKAFNPDKQTGFENAMKRYSFDTAWYLLEVGREYRSYHYPLQAHLELSISKDRYKSKIFEILINMGVPIENYKGYCPFRHLLNLIIKENDADQRDRYKKCVDILIKKGFNFDVPLAKANGHYDGSDTRYIDLIDADAQATGRTCIAKAVEYCQKNRLDDRLALLEQIKQQIDSIPVASTIRKDLPLSEKESAAALATGSATPLITSSTSPAASIEVGATSADGLLPYVVVMSSSKKNNPELPIAVSNPKPSSSSSIPSSSPSTFHTLQGTISPVAPVVPHHIEKPNPAPQPVPATIMPGTPLDSGVPVGETAQSTVKSRLFEWCKTTGSTRIQENVCLLMVGAVAVLAATKLMYSNWWQKKSSVSNDTSFTIILKNMTEDELLIDVGQSITTLSGKGAQSFDMNTVSKLTIKPTATDNMSKSIYISLWPYKKYRRSGQLHIIIKPETAQWKRWLFGTQYTYTISWQ